MSYPLQRVNRESLRMQTALRDQQLRPRQQDSVQQQSQKRYARIYWNSLVQLTRAVDLQEELDKTGQLQNGQGRSSITSDLLLMDAGSKAVYQRQEARQQQSTHRLQQLSQPGAEADGPLWDSRA